MTQQIFRRTSIAFAMAMSICSGTAATAAPGVHAREPAPTIEQAVIAVQQQLTQEGYAMVSPGVHK